MKLSCYGVSRWIRSHKLSGASWMKGPRAHLNKTKPAVVLMTSTHKNLSLNGKYWFSLELSRADAAQLFALAYEGATIDECIDAMKAARKGAPALF